MSFGQFAVVRSIFGNSCSAQVRGFDSHAHFPGLAIRVESVLQS